MAITSSSDRVVGEPNPSDFYEVWLVDWPVPIRIDYAAIRDGRAGRNDQERVGLLLGSSSHQGLHIKRLLFQPAGEFTKLPAFPEDAPQLLGFFRTQATGWPAVRESDRNIARKYFKTEPSASSVLVLLIHTTMRRPWSAQLFVVEAGKEATPASMPPAVEFPFDENVLRHRRLNDDARGSDLDAPPGGAGRSKVIWIILIALLSMLVGGAGAYAWFHRTAPSAPEEADRFRSQPSSPALTKGATDLLALKVNRSGNDFEVSWDRQSDAVRQALDAVLTVRDGATTRTLRLGATQLREGKILYSPLFGELNFRLEVVMNNHRTLAESVTVFGWNGSLPSVTAPAADPDLTTSLVAPTPPPGRIPRQTPLPEPKQQRTARKPDIAVDPVPHEPPQSAPAKAPETPEPAPAAIPRLPLNTQPPSPSPSQARAIPQAPPPAPKKEVPSSNVTTVVPDTAPVRAATSPVETSRPKAVPEPQRPSPSKVLQPEPIRKVTPAVTSKVLATIQSSSQGKFSVSVEVAIDASGNVKSAEVVSVDGTALASGVFTMKAAAVDAARSWKFRPGLLDGKSVPSTYTIQFNFR